MLVSCRRCSCCGAASLLSIDIRRSFAATPHICVVSMCVSNVCTHVLLYVMLYVCMHAGNFAVYAHGHTTNQEHDMLILFPIFLFFLRILRGRQLGQTAARGGASVRAGMVFGAHAIATSMHPMHSASDRRFLSMVREVSLFIFLSRGQVALEEPGDHHSSAGSFLRQTTFDLRILFFSSAVLLGWNQAISGSEIWRHLEMTNYLMR